ncbi:Protein TIFY 4B-like isoform X1 [Ranunculus cassubicifolius]
MSRPSWNETQATEEVIFLKPLPEHITESKNHTVFRQRIQIPVIETEYDGDMQISVSTNENELRQGRSPSIGSMSRDVPDPAHDRNLNITNGLTGQMTIFYCGNVYFFDSVTVDKAHAILQIAASDTTMYQAASDTTLYQDSPAIGNAGMQLLEYPLQVASTRSGFSFSSGVYPPLHNAATETSQLYRDAFGRSREVDLEGRQASLQRYLDKRKDRRRFKFMRRVDSSSNLEMYLNHQIPSEQSSQGMGYSPPQPRPPHTPRHCNSVENQPPDNAGISIDLNKNGTQRASSLKDFIKTGCRLVRVLILRYAN